MKKLFILLISLFSVTIATENLKGKSEIIFSYKGPKDVLVRLYHNNQLLETITYKDVVQIEMPNNEYTFEVQVKDAKKQFTVYAYDNIVYVEISTKQIRSSIIIKISKKTEPLPTPTPQLTRETKANGHLERGNIYFNNKAYDMAITEYSEAIQLNPNFTTAYNNRGNAYYNKGDYDRAIADYTQAIRLNPNFAAMYFNRGDAYYKKMDYDRAIANYEATLKIDPNHSGAKNNMEIAIQAKTTIQQVTHSESTYKSNKNLNTIGVSIGTSFATPALIGTIHGTFAPIPNIYLELGIDLGLIYGGSNDSEDYSVDDYYSLYPFVNIGYFLPITNEDGWYLGAGIGYMFGKYTFDDGEAYINIPAFNLITGFIINNFFNISYTLRTNFKGVNNKVTAGIIYRFK